MSRRLRELLPSNKVRPTLVLLMVGVTTSGVFMSPVMPGVPSSRVKVRSLLTLIDAFSVQGTPDEIGPVVRARYGDLVQRISFDTSAQLDADRVAGVLAGLRD